MIDKRTGREFGDHGEGHQAIEWALDNLENHYEFRGFLESWMEGDLDDFPEFYEWLSSKENNQ